MRYAHVIERTKTTNRPKLKRLISVLPIYICGHHTVFPAPMPCRRGALGSSVVRWRVGIVGCPVVGMCILGRRADVDGRRKAMPNARNAQCRMPNAECQVPNAQCPMPNAECRMPNVRCPVSYSRDHPLCPWVCEPRWFVPMRFILTAWSAERKGQNRKIGGADHARPGVGEIVLPALIDMDVSEVVLGNENSREGVFLLRRGCGSVGLVCDVPVRAWSVARMGGGRDSA